MSKFLPSNVPEDSLWYGRSVRQITTWQKRKSRVIPYDVPAPLRAPMDE